MWGQLPTHRMSFLLINLLKNSRVRGGKRWGAAVDGVGDQKPCMAVAGEAGAPLNRVIMRLTQIPWHSGSRLCLSELCNMSALSPSGSGMGPRAAQTHSDGFRKLRRLSGVAVDPRLVL